MLGQTIVGSVLQNGVGAYWWTGKPNFGDLLTPCLLRNYGYSPILLPPEECHFISTGSILQLLPGDYSGMIFGSGLISPEHARPYPNAFIAAVRGALTKELIQAPKNTILGDPGLLACGLLKRSEQKKFELGIVPHYVDAADPRVHNIARRYAKEVRIIDVKRSPHQVIREIDNCSHILSSSLHGVVVADSLGIPNGWLVLSDQVDGQGFKFRDYYSAYGATCTPVTISGNEKLRELMGCTRLPNTSVEDVRETMHEAFLTYVPMIVNRTG